jgi:hypothetical protein
MGALDPTNNAANLAALQARVDSTFPNSGASFTLAQAATLRLKGDNPFQGSLLPVTGSRVAIAWSARYRATNLTGSLIVVDATNQAMGEAAILADAKATLDAADIRMTSIGAGGTAYDPDAPIDLPVGRYDPTLKGDARWLDAVVQNKRYSW